MDKGEGSSAAKKQRTARQAEAKRKAIKQRLSQAGRRSFPKFSSNKDGGKATPGSATGSTPWHAEQIATFHALEKQLAQAKGKEREVILEKQQALGGLEAYQAASSHGAKNGESSRWLVQQLEARHGRRDTKLLDVGAIAGTAYRKYKSMKPTYIDLNPQAEHVIQADFLEFPLPKADEKPYDVVCLSLVINFVGDLAKRTEMVARAHDFVTPEGYLYIVLPLACVQNSRYIDHERFTGILGTLGWSTVSQYDSALLTHWLLQRSKPDKQKWPRKEVRKGVHFNNFVVLVK